MGGVVAGLLQGRRLTFGSGLFYGLFLFKVFLGLFLRRSLCSCGTGRNWRRLHRCRRRGEVNLLFLLLVDFILGLFALGVQLVELF